ncbi:MAG: YbhB/YbcL family Raf kinase inhibitor-like protein [Candidatus Methanofastidiosia archaeon]|jgi:Raf kinase inhibitor-like YbhB/YbcL family protein
MIPSKYTCQGENISPEISWDAVPGAQGYIVIMTDPDVPHRYLPLATWVHWVVYNIPKDVTHLPEGIPKTKLLENDSRQGKTSFKDAGYGGPCPPFGTHRYYFRVYAVDNSITLTPEKATRKQILNY